MPVQNPYYSVVNGLNPKLYFRFNETAGTPVNTGSLSCTLTAVGTPLLNNDTVVDGRSVFLNGSSNYYNLSNFPSFSLFDDRSYTIELWYKQSAKVTTNTKPVLFQAVNGSSSYAKIRIGGASTALNERGQILVDYRPAVGGTIYTIRTSGLPVGWTDGINDTNWHHIAVTFNTTNVKIYVDGVNYASTTISTPASIDFDDSTTIKQIGGEYFVGLVDEFAAYDRELTSTEIADNYYAGANVSFLDTAGTASALAVQPALYLDKIAYADPMTASALLPLPNATVTKPLLETVLSGLTLQQWYKFNAQSVSAGLTNYGTTSSSAWAVQPETLAKDGLGPNNQNCIYVDRTNIAALRTVDSVAPDATINDEDFTIGLWFRAPSGSANKYLFFANDPNGDQVRIELDSNKYIKYSIITNQGTYTVTGSTALDDNAWHFATLKYQTSNGGLMYGYIDGSLISSTAVSGNMSDAHQFNFDGTGTYLSNFFVATFAAITATDISNIYNAGSQFIQAAAILPTPLLRFNNQWDDHLETLGPVNWIKFNEASGNIIDYGTRAVTWTKTGTNCSYEKLAKNRYAIEFTNPDTYFTATSNYNSGGMSDNYATITAIVKMSTAPATLCWLAISGYGSNTDAGMALGIRFDGKPIFRILGSSFTTVVGASAITDGNWHLVTGVMDNGTIRIYIDGKQSNTNTTALTLSDSSHPIIIGGSETVINSLTDARTYQLDEVAFFEQALSAQQVFELWQKIQIDIATAATSEFVMPAFNVGTGNTQTVAPATASADIVNPAVTTEISITPDHLEAFGEFLHPNYGANINIDAEYGHSAFTADALFHDPQFNIGDGHSAASLDASALMVNPTIFAGGNVSVNTLVGGDAVFVDPGIVTIRGAKVNAAAMTSSAFMPIPPAYFTLQDDKWYLRLFAQHTTPNIEDAFITSSTPTAATQVAKTFLKFFNNETVSIAPGSIEKLENNLTVNDADDLSASLAANLTPAPLMTPGFFDAQGRKAVLFENIEFEIDEEIYNSRKPYSLEFSIKTTKTNQIVAKGKWRSYTGNQRAETGLGLYNGKLYIMQTNTTTGTIGDRTPHPSNPDVGGTLNAIIGNKNVADGQWHHIIVQQGYEDNRIQIWVDGQLDRQYIGVIYSRPYIIGNNSGNATYRSEFYTSAWSYDKQEFLSEYDVSLNYIGYLQYEPIKAAPMLATANIGNHKAQGNRGRALLLYWWPVTGLDDINNTDRGQNGYFDESTFDKEVLTIDYVEQPPEQWYGWDLYPVDINGRYVSDFVKVESYGGAENIRLNVTNPGARQPLTIKENRRGYFRDPITDARRYIDLVNDIDLSNFDAIFFRNYPDQSRELDNYTRDEFSDSYFNLRERELYEDFVKSVRAAVDTGLSLFVSNTQLALDLGIVDRVEEVSDLYDIENKSDPYAPTQLPAEYEILLEKGIFTDTYRNNKFRVVNTIEELTGDASYILTESIYFKNNDAIDFGGANRYWNNYEKRPDGLQVGDEFIYANYQPEYSVKYQAVPFANVKCGTIITAFSNTVRNGLTEITNPYKDYATSIAVRPGDILNGTPVRGKIFVNFTERISGETFAFLERRIVEARELGEVDLITDYWINEAFNINAINAEKRDEYLSALYNLDRQLENNQITLQEYNKLVRWDLNGQYILTQRQTIASSDAQGDAELYRGAPKRAFRTKYNKAGIPTKSGTAYSGQFFTFKYSREFPTMIFEDMSLLTRGIRWLSTRTEDVGLVIRTEAMRASITSVHPDSVVADYDNSVNAPALVASATIIEGVGYTLTDRNIAPVPMSAYGTFGEFVRSVSANVMTATANFREVRSQAVEVDEIVVYISYVEPILYLREDIIK